jgi:hypothetical protein
MLQIKEKLLALYTRRFIKSNKTARLNVGYKQAKVIGLLYTQEDDQKKAVMLNFIEQLRNTGKNIEVLQYIPQISAKNQALDTNFPSFSNRDVNYLGKCLNGQLASFIDTPFDYLYHIDLASNPILDYLLVKCKAKCRVGNFDINRAHLFEIMVKFEPKTDIYALHSLAKEMLYYTQLLEI